MTWFYFHSSLLIESLVLILLSHLLFCIRHCEVSCLPSRGSVYEFLSSLPVIYSAKYREYQTFG